MQPTQFYTRLLRAYERFKRVYAPIPAEHMAWHGHVIVTARYADGSVEVDEFDNMIMDAGRNLIRDTLSGKSADCKIRYVALGSGTTAPSVGQTKLATEQYRHSVTKQTPSSSTPGMLTTTVYVPPADATTFTINEIGWFAGPAAGSAKDSGVMIARVLYTRAKTNLESLQIDRIDTFA